jgi:hypothetical protein
VSACKRPVRAVVMGNLPTHFGEAEREEIKGGPSFLCLAGGM